MTIAQKQFEALGARTYLPEGPFGVAGQMPLPSFALGTVIAGDYEAEFVYLQFVATASVTINQGDVFTWDNSYNAVLTPAAASGSISFGANIGTLFLGGRIGDPAGAGYGQGNVFSYLFPVAGAYGIWVQRAGTSLLNLATVNAQTKPINTTAVAGQVNAPAAPLANSMGITGVFAAPTTGTFTANTTTGSVNLTAVSTNKFVVIGQTLSGTGIPNGAYVKDIQGNIIVMSVAATATNTGTTITAANLSTWGNTTNNSAALTGIPNIPGIYPNQTIAGTGIPGSTTILSITGTPGNYSITMSANATANGTTINFTTTGYWESYLRWPFVSSQN